MPENFEGIGVAFLYPDSWTVEPDPETKSVTIVSPEGGFFSVTRLESNIEPEAALERSMGVMRKEYDEIECEPIEKTIVGLRWEGQRLEFIYLDLIISAQFLALPHASGLYVVQFQAESREYEEVEPVFEAMLTSLCQSLPDSGPAV